jgi:hypothetical protein
MTSSQQHAPETALAGTILGVEAFRQHLAALVSASTLTAVAREHGCNVQYLSNLISGRKYIGAKTALRFGYQRQSSVVFVPSVDSETLLTAPKGL